MKTQTLILIVPALAAAIWFGSQRLAPDKPNEPVQEPAVEAADTDTFVSGQFVPNSSAKVSGSPHPSEEFEHVSIVRYRDSAAPGSGPAELDFKSRQKGEVDPLSGVFEFSNVSPGDYQISCVSSSASNQHTWYRMEFTKRGEPLDLGQVHHGDHSVELSIQFLDSNSRLPIEGLSDELRNTPLELLLRSLANNRNNTSAYMAWHPGPPMKITGLHPDNYAFLLNKIDYQGGVTWGRYQLDGPLNAEAFFSTETNGGHTSLTIPVLVRDGPRKHFLFPFAGNPRGMTTYAFAYQDGVRGVEQLRVVGTVGSDIEFEAPMLHQTYTVVAWTHHPFGNSLFGKATLSENKLDPGAMIDVECFDLTVKISSSDGSHTSKNPGLALVDSAGIVSPVLWPGSAYGSGSVTFSSVPKGMALVLLPWGLPLDVQGTEATVEIP